MTTIGIYDSGIGGLTTLKTLYDYYKNANFVYFADNASMPFGSRSKQDIENLVSYSLQTLQSQTDVQVLACNTASMSYNLSPDVIKLKPNLEKLNDSGTLTMATPLTINLLKENLDINNQNFKHTNTHSLAMLVENCAEYSYVTQKPLNFDCLKKYLHRVLDGIFNVDTVIIGCSHYVYVERAIKDILNNKNFDNGNLRVLEQLQKIGLNDRGEHTIKFIFSGANEMKKYKYILENLK